MGKTKQWKQGGEEDKILKKLVTKGKINKYTKPANLQRDYPAVFGEFTPNVIRNHFTSIKRDMGLFRELCCYNVF